MRTYISIILVLLSCVRIFAQENIIVPISKPSQNSVSGSAPKTASIKIRLACELNGERRYYSTREWSQLEIEDRDQNNIIGLVIGSGDSAFMISPYNNMGRALSDSTYSFQVAMNKTGGQLPTRAQLSVLSKYNSTIEWAFGGEGYSRLKLWCKEGYCIDMKTNAVSSDKMAAFRIATDDVDKGFFNVVVEKQDNEDYDYTGKAAPKGRDYLQLVRLKEKFGYVDTCGKVRIPMMFDDVCWGRFKYGYDEYWNGEGLMPVSINGKWGYINKESKVIIPIAYDKVEQSHWIDDNYYKGLLKVYRGSSVGAFNIKGEVVFPLKYGEIERYYGKDGLYYVKDKKYGGKYGFFDSKYQMVIPFKYGAVGGFNYRKDVALCYVGNYIDEKGKWQYGYIDRSGKEVIPLIYDFASRFYNGLAAVIKDGKLGYINESGETVIPISFDFPYKTIIVKEDERDVEETFFGSGFWSPYIAFVYRNGKYAIIRNDGKLLSDFKYDKIKGHWGNNYTVLCDTTVLHIDKGGNEYISEEELRKNSNRILAEQGFAEGQHDYGIELLNAGDIEQAIQWLHKAEKNGEPFPYRQIGLHYKRKKDFYSALAYFMSAEEKGDIESILEQGILLFENESKYENSYLQALASFNKYLMQSDKKAPSKSTAYYYIGKIYYYGGFGVSESYSAAFENLSKSVARDAYYYIGWMYEHGQGVSVDIEKAIDNYRRCNGGRDSKERIARLLSTNRKEL